MPESGKRDRFVVLGAGQLGLAVMDALVETQNDISIANTSGTLKEPVPDGVTVLQADLADPDSVESIARNADAAILCAAPAYTDWPAKFPPLAESVVEGLSRTGARLVFADNLYAYGSTLGAPIREDLPYAAAGAKGRARAQVATILMDAHEAGRLPVTIARASDFFGPRVTASALGERVFGPALRGETVNVLGDVYLPHTYTYIRDFAGALVTLAGREEAFGEIWHVPNAPTTTTQQWLDLIGQQLGHPLTVRSAGKMLVSVLGLFNPDLRELREMMYEFTEPYIVDDAKYRAAFGGEATEPAEAAQETLDWYRQHYERS